MVLNKIRSSFRLFYSIRGIANLIAWFVYRSIESALRETSINTNRSIHRGEMMQQDTTIRLIKLSLKNYEETNDLEHLKDIKRIIDARLRKHKKPATGTC